MGSERPQSWWQRNWKWFVPAGCLTLAALAGAFTALVVSLAFGALKSSQPYARGVERAQRDCELQELLGAPIRAGWLVGGSVEVSGPSGSADLSVPLRGANGGGKLYLTATKAAGRWSFELLEAEVAGRAERIDLLAAGRPTCEWREPD